MRMAKTGTRTATMSRLGLRNASAPRMNEAITQLYMPLSETIGTLKKTIPRIIPINAMAGTMSQKRGLDINEVAVVVGLITITRRLPLFCCYCTLIEPIGICIDRNQKYGRIMISKKKVK
ncbi:hypothetical protein AZH53_05325 [Methanomicrobiaceae archaeon CYW5]|nr:hypothetical protein [Methanovulcanius yangii]